MRCLAVCQDELVIRMLDEILLPGFEVEFIVESRPLARRLHDAGVTRRSAIRGAPTPTSRPTSAPGTCVIIEDNGRRSLKKDSRGGARRGRHARLRARRRRGRDRQARRRAPRRVPRRRLSVDVGAVRRAAADRVQPVADARARPAVSAVFQRRRPRADPAAQRSGSPTRWPAAWRCATSCAGRRRRPSSAPFRA